MISVPSPAGGSLSADRSPKTARRPLHGRASVILEQGVVTSQKIPTPTTWEALRRARAIAKARREREQRPLLSDDLLFHDQILTKLKTDDRIDPVTGEWFAPSAQLQNFARCGHENVYETCVGCDSTTVRSYHCMIKWCPLCNWRIVSRRRDLLKQWLPTIHQPKHLVTTQRNTATLTRRMIKDHTLNLARLRRHKVFSQVKGGCVSVEITNESKGWHLHAHWLVDARWVDQRELALAWGSLVGQQYAIVKVLDARKERGEGGDHRGGSGESSTPSNYQRELMKYVVKGSDLAKWSQCELYQFINAVRGQRFFFAFGDLFKRARQLRALAEHNKPEREPCDCGCSQRVFSSDDYLKRKRKRQR